MLRTSAAVALVAAAAAVSVPAFAASQPAHTAAARAKLLVRPGSLGKYVTDASGRSLYLFTRDSSRRSACNGSCATMWPPYLTSGKPSAGSGISAAKLGTIKRSNGSTQVTYDGHPLYRYAPDTAKGQTRGEGVESLWYLVTPAGRKLVKATAPTTAPTTTPGYGY